MFHYDGSTPGPFNYYVAASPSVFWSDGYLFGLEESLAQNTSRLPYHLYLSVGGDEPAVMPIFMEEMHDRLKACDYDGLYITREILKDKSHNEASIPGFVNGLIFVFNN